MNSYISTNKKDSDSQGDVEFLCKYFDVLGFILEIRKNRFPVVINMEPDGQQQEQSILIWIFPFFWIFTKYSIKSQQRAHYPWRSDLSSTKMSLPTSLAGVKQEFRFSGIARSSMILLKTDDSTFTCQADQLRCTG